VLVLGRSLDALGEAGLEQFLAAVQQVKLFVVATHRRRHVDDGLRVVDGVELILGHVVDVADDVAVALRVDVGLEVDQADISASSSGTEQTGVKTCAGARP
jgi:hypothetical protein